MAIRAQRTNELMRRDEPKKNFQSLMIGPDQNLFFIKLGQGGEWEKECIESQGTIRLGFREADHDLCLKGNWVAVAEHYRNVERASKGKATEYSNQIRAFYEEPNSTVWFTFYGGFLWWCTAEASVERLADGTKIRRVMDSWRRTDTRGNLITLDDLSGKLLQTRGFRGTICQPSAIEYLRRRLNGEKMPEVIHAITAKTELVASIVPVIQSLSPQDFELLIDLIFRQGGWQRAGIVGGTEKDIDLYLYSPVTKERIAIQVKSKSSLSEFRDYLNRFSSMPNFSRFFYVVHSGGEELMKVDAPKHVTVIAGAELGDLAVRAGLTDWVIGKAG
jgi:hypothetical protein